MYFNILILNYHNILVLKYYNITVIMLYSYKCMTKSILDNIHAIWILSVKRDKTFCRFILHHFIYAGCPPFQTSVVRGLNTEFNFIALSISVGNCSLESYLC